MHAQISVAHPSLLDSIDNLSVEVENRMLAAINCGDLKGRDAPVGATGAADAAVYHLGSGGLRVRAHLGLYASLALGLSKNDAVTIAATAELLHNASLVHDDLQDRDPFRRGVPAVWAAFGINVAVCAGDLLLSAAYGALCNFSNPRALPSLLERVHERTAAAIAGQCADLSFSASTDKGIAWYEQTAAAKSGALFGLPLELALLGSGHARATSDARRAAKAFSVSYQIADDLHDVQNDAGVDDALPALNIAFILKASGYGTDARAAAKKLGLQHLSAAVSAAERLPCESGALLLVLAHDLREFMTVREV